MYSLRYCHFFRNPKTPPYFQLTDPKRVRNRLSSASSILKKKMNELPLFFSSNPNLGAFLRPDRTGTYLGNNFDVRLPRPITLHNASNITVELSAINIWNSIPNISEEKGNNVLRIVDSKNNNIDITIPKGSYVVDTLNTSLQRLLNEHLLKNLFHQIL